MTDLLIHLLMFAGLAGGLLYLPLLIGRFIRPNQPTAEKVSIYECGEPSIGSSEVQFDLRFYVIALIFIVFDVEVVFFFPWSTIYGRGLQLTDTQLPDSARSALSTQLLAPAATAAADAVVLTPETALVWTWLMLAELIVFFGILLVGFAYVWKRGDLEWVKVFAQPTHPTVDDVLIADGSPRG